MDHSDIYQAFSSSVCLVSKIFFITLKILTFILIAIICQQLLTADYTCNEKKLFIYTLKVIVCQISGL